MEMKDLGKIEINTPALVVIPQEIKDFVQHVKDVINTHLHKDFPESAEKLFKFTLKCEVAQKWFKIYHVEDNRSSNRIYCFIAIQENITKMLGHIPKGGIYKPASYKIPAKHARGSIYDKSTWTCAGPYGIAYLK